ncbi:hypothetical protein SKAU_G00358860 [Synaphobranchus kaupii]|uniref:Uncharacterized protein n=1 Tax=Synaphobranchus kaupii TaxID=118154 RepID=A0A9Q1EHY2_SYNKA|nr:hypothetical protein SKAU_G00358860 [Synaphobranchus kaupii]
MGYQRSAALTSSDLHHYNFSDSAHSSSLCFARPANRSKSLQHTDLTKRRFEVWERDGLAVAALDRPASLEPFSAVMSCWPERHGDRVCPLAHRHGNH